VRRLFALPALGLVAAVALVSLLVAGPADFGDASSHRDAPLITEDPTVDNTDLYAYVSTEPGRQDYVTLIANFIPLEEPGEGPNYYRFSDTALYNINVDTNGDARSDLVYQFDFSTKIGAVTPNTFLYNTGKIGLPPNPGDPTSQYTNWNQQSSYKLTEIRGDNKTVLLSNARAAPINIGPKSTGTQAEYEALANAAIHNLAGGARVFAGPRDEGFYVDLMGNFDLINVRDPGVDTTSGFNVHTIALEVPKSKFMQSGDTDGRIGVWTSAERPTVRILRDGGQTPIEPGIFTQVSRLGNPLVNEVLIPLAAKDKYNGSPPSLDGQNIRDFIVNPGNSQGNAALIPIINSLTGCTPLNDRTDLELALLKGIPDGVIPGFPGNQDTQRPGGPVVADMLRLNYNVAPAGSPNTLGLLGGDIAGFPNGRRVGDDVTDIDLKAAAGAVLHVLGAINCPASLTLGDNVNGNDVPYLGQFPYLGTPHNGYNHDHDHSGLTSPSALAAGFGLLGLALALGVAVPRILPRLKRRSDN
jgi:Domain of unknown function (DUF4331)